MWQIFTEESPYKKRARTLAMLWTLLIFIACFIPGHDLPEVEVPLIDKWVHILLFGGYSLLWLCTQPSRRPGFLFIIFFSSVCLGSLVEILQGLLSFLGRSYDLMDIAADSVGGLCGILLFYLMSLSAEKKGKTAR